MCNSWDAGVSKQEMFLMFRDDCHSLSLFARISTPGLDCFVMGKIG